MGVSGLLLGPEMSGFRSWTGVIVAVNRRREAVYRVGTGEEVPLVPGTPVLSSAETPWDGVFLERHVAEGLETGPVTGVNHVLFMPDGDPVDGEWMAGGEWGRRRWLPRQVGLIPAGVPYGWRVRARTSFVIVSIQPRFLDGIALDLSGRGWVDLVPRLAVQDLLVAGILQALGEEAAAGAGANRLYGESLGAALAVHLVKEYSAGGRSLVEPRGGLTRLQLRLAMDHLHERLGEQLRLEELARAVGMSPFHFSRRFRRSTGVPPHRYLIRLRVQRAREMLLRGAATLAEVAVRVGFYDQSHLATHFKAAFGVTPGRFVSRRVSAAS
jgi:AraC family transcriptional regulator